MARSKSTRSAKSKKAQPRILVTEDITPDTEHAGRSLAVRTAAAWLAGNLGTGLDLVHIDDLALYPVNHAAYKDIIDDYMSRQKSELASLGAEIGRSHRIQCRPLFLSGAPVAKILELAAKRGAYELVVMGTHGRKGLSRLLLGSVAEDVIRNAKAPVMVLGPQAQGLTRSLAQRSGPPVVLIATDLGANSRKAEAYGLSLAKRLKAKVVLVHCLYQGMHPVLQTAFASRAGGASDDTLGALFPKLLIQASKQLDKLRAQFQKAGVPCESLLDQKSLSATQTLLEEISRTQPSLVVLGTHGRTLAAQAFLGRTARTVILESPAPVITVKSR